MGDEADRIVINVGGVAYETYISTLQNIPDTRLAWLTEGLDADPNNRKEIFFDRHSGVFVHILNYYRTGKLHTPTDICGPLFEEELNFWGIDEKQMEPCCWESFTKHREAEVNLKSFEGPGFEDLKTFKSRKFSSFSTQDGMTCRERMDQIWYIMDRPHSSKIAKYTSILSCFMIVLSVTVYCLNTLPSLQNLPVWRKARHAIDVFCMCWFTIEFAVRVLVCPDRAEFVKSISNWIDFLSVIPSYLKLFSIRDSWLVNLVIIRLLRLFRFFKLSYGLQVLLHTLKASFYELVLLLLILLIPIVIFSSLVHTIEMKLTEGNSTKFVSIPATFWWCLITMTSVGYGDMVPETWAGKMVGSLCAICGVLIVALPISVIGSNFSLYYAHVRARLKLPSKDRKLLAGNIRGLLKQPLSLSSRERDRRILKRNNLPALKRKGGARNRVINEPINHQSPSATSEDEVACGSLVDQTNYSDNCLDWDSTVDSDIKFSHMASHRKRKYKFRKNVTCNNSGIVSGSDSAKDTHDNVTFIRSRRGGKCSLYQSGESIRSTDGLKKSYTVTLGDDISSEQSINENVCSDFDPLCEKSSIFSTISQEKQIDSRRNSESLSSRRTSMKLMDIEIFPNEHTLFDCRRKYAQIAYENESRVEMMQPMNISNITKYQFPTSVPETDTLIQRYGDFENENGFLFDCGEAYSLMKSSSAQNSSENIGFDRCPGLHEPVASQGAKTFGASLSRIKSTSRCQTSANGTILEIVNKDDELKDSILDLEKQSDEDLSRKNTTLNSVKNAIEWGKCNELAKKFSQSEINLKFTSHIQRSIADEQCLRRISSNVELRLPESTI